MGDKQRASLQLEFAKFDSDVIKNIHEEDKNIPLVTVLLAGRPMLIDGIMSESSVVLDAFLPGTSGGQGIVDALTGQYVLRPNGQSDRVNSLSFDWPKSSVIYLITEGTTEKVPCVQSFRRGAQNRRSSLQARLRVKFLYRRIDNVIR